jgi:hypothetical protein
MGLLLLWVYCSWLIATVGVLLWFSLRLWAYCSGFMLILAPMRMRCAGVTFPRPRRRQIWLAASTTASLIEAVV